MSQAPDGRWPLIGPPTELQPKRPYNFDPALHSQVVTAVAKASAAKAASCGEWFTPAENAAAMAAAAYVLGLVQG